MLYRRVVFLSCFQKFLGLVHRQFWFGVLPCLGVSVQRRVLGHQHGLLVFEGAVVVVVLYFFLLHPTLALALFLPQQGRFRALVGDGPVTVVVVPLRFGVQG